LEAYPTGTQMREEADGSGVVNGQGVRSGMLSNLARKR
jgi:hypothetical protein